LCEGTESDRDSPLAAPPPDTRIGLILRTRTRTEGGGVREPREAPAGSGGCGRRHLRAFGVFYKILESAGLNTSAAPHTWDAGWARVRQVLEGVSPYAGSARRMSDFAWMPGGTYKGGLRGLNDRLRDLWTERQVQAEGWAFFVIPELPPADEVEIHTLPSKARARLAEGGGQLYPPYRLKIARSQIAPIGRTGPYLGLAVASANGEGDPAFAKPNFHRLLLVSVATESWLLPVESNHERDAAWLLRRLEVPFVKPLFADAEGLRPDFLLSLRGRPAVLEVQGMNTDEYREHKREVHGRIRASQIYRGQPLITYDPNDGETVRDLEDKLSRAAG
jgi:hypothetical protein